MRCLLCQSWSLKYICKTCEELHLKPSLQKRVLPNGLEVYYFYKYKEIEELIKSKYFFIGYFIYRTLARLSFKEFSKSFLFDEKVYAFACDASIKNGYSNTSLLSRYLKSNTIKPLYNKLISTTNISYAGKTLDFRLRNPKQFEYKFKSNINAILVDDTVVSGTTLSQAEKELAKYNVNVLFAITLCDAKE